MRVKPKGVMIYRFGTDNRCTVFIRQNQVWDALVMRKENKVVLTRDNIEICIPESDFYKHFKEEVFRYKEGQNEEHNAQYQY